MLQLCQVGVKGRLEPLSGQVAAGVQVHLIGPNGAGKSTLLARVAGILPGLGEIRLSEKLLGDYSGMELAKRRAYLSQQQSAMSLMPVFQYLALHRPVGCGESVLESTITYLCRRLKLTDKLSRMLSKLSGGEWQRVRLAAVLLQVWPTVNPQSQLLLLDEPTNSLDVAQKAALDHLLREFCHSGRSVMICAHDLNHTLQQADEVWLLQAGRLIAKGSTLDVMVPELLSRVYEIDFHLQSSGSQRWIMTKSV
ncbi:vitamin B12 ABC transporter ATP-binding protein BtuD [Serratia sp. UGAL515B_01]|uniref:vitamin B12 ABC transporter ATP-binding protein BtuD n=1 Tax=Serratia sp. UGAL515B_01 TaxID=2986763 RepID=UPI002954FD25|nr:vitamin B12 ABC transporter ATP-binding protein BtuD [Serratia sp. UGAL515B_01]WON78776.1 vitamin B12 ABC transporter ATP-binding protein BtuD [Serratia sp. UGAL515B_01]